MTVDPRGVWIVIALAVLATIALMALGTGLFVAVGVALRRKSTPTATQTAAATGAIVGVWRTYEDVDGGTWSCPVVRFQSAAGQAIEFNSPLGYARPPVAGQPVRVRYNPADPRDALIDSHAHRIFDGCFLVFASLGCAFTAVLGLGALAVVALVLWLLAGGAR